MFDPSAGGGGRHKVEGGGGGGVYPTLPDGMVIVEDADAGPATPPQPTRSLTTRFLAGCKVSAWRRREVFVLRRGKEVFSGGGREACNGCSAAKSKGKDVILWSVATSFECVCGPALNLVT